MFLEISQLYFVDSQEVLSQFKTAQFRWGCTNAW